MVKYLKSILSPMISLFILILGNGYLMTLVPIRASIEGFSPEISGYLASVYFAGMLIGAIQINKIIEGVGHIRAFAFFASFMSALVLIQGIYVTPMAWIVNRFLFGLCMAGIFITIESWLMVKSTIERRGIALSIYMTIFYAGQSGGQLFLGFFDSSTLLPFYFIVMLTSLSVLPLTITKTKAPIVEEHSLLSPLKLYKMAPLAVVGAFFAGLVLGPIYGLYPIYVQEIDFSTKEISWIMGGLIIGGLFFQWPLGGLSDRIDRRKVLLLASIVVSILTLFASFFPQTPYPIFLIFSILLGGFCFVLYPLCIAHACDLVESKDLVAATGGLLLSYGLGSIIGPIIASYGMRIIGHVAFFYFLFITVAILTLIILFKIIKSKKIPHEEKLPYSNIPQTTPIALELNPRIEEPSEDEKKN